jgi:hypothetical protein
LRKPSSPDTLPSSWPGLKSIAFGRSEANTAHHEIQLRVGAMIDVPRTTDSEAGPFGPSEA